MVNGSGEIAKTTNSGFSWTISQPTTKPINNVVFINNDTGFIVGNGGEVWRTEDQGFNWALQSFPTTKILNDIVFTSDLNGHIVGNDGYYYQTTDGGLSWDSTKLYDNGGADNIMTVFFVNENIGYIAGDNGLIMKTYDGGVTWNGFSKMGCLDFFNMNMRTLFFTDHKTGYVGGSPHWIFKTNSGSELCPIANFSFQDTMCPGDFGIFQTISTCDQLFSWNYKWRIDGNEFDTSETATVQINKQGFNTIYLEASFPSVPDSVCQADTSVDSIYVTELHYPTWPSAGIYCDSLLLNPDGDFISYVWSDNSVDSELVITESGAHWVILNYKGCEFLDSTEAYEISDLQSNLEDDITTCSEALLEAGGSENSYLWSTAETSNAITVMATGTYSVQITKGNCSLSDSISVTILQNNTNASFIITDSTPCLENGFASFSFENTSSGNYGCSNWEFGDNTGSIDIEDAEHVYFFPGQFNVKLKICDTSTGCKDSTFKTINIDYCSGINNYENAVARVYPSIGSGIIYFEFSKSTQYNMKVMSLNGQVLMNELIDDNRTADLTFLQSGAYFLKLTNQEKIVFKEKIQIIK